jgi:hypothetical protein
MVRCETVVTSRPEDSTEAANGLVEPKLTIFHRTGMHIGSTLVRARQKTQVRIVNVNDQSYVLAEGTTLGRCESVTSTTPIDDIEPQP